MDRKGGSCSERVPGEESRGGETLSGEGRVEGRGNRHDFNYIWEIILVITRKIIISKSFQK